jgi:hypothetical protein
MNNASSYLELKDTLCKVLEHRGIMDKLRATVRAELFAEIDATSNAVIIEQIYPSGNFYLW